MKKGTNSLGENRLHFLKIEILLLGTRDAQLELELHMLRGHSWDRPCTTDELRGNDDELKLNITACITQFKTGLRDRFAGFAIYP